MSAEGRSVRNGSVAEIVIDRPKDTDIDRATSRGFGEGFAAFRDDPEPRIASARRSTGTAGPETCLKVPRILPTDAIHREGDVMT